MGEVTPAIAAAPTVAQGLPDRAQKAEAQQRCLQEVNTGTHK